MNKISEFYDYIQSSLVDFQSITDANIACNVLVGAFASGINKFSKTMKPSRRRVPLKLWISPGILCSINRKNKLYKKFLRSRNVQNENKYKNIEIS